MKFLKYLLFFGGMVAVNYYGSLPFFVVVIYVSIKCFADPGSKMALQTEKMEMEVLDATAQYLLDEIQKIPIAELYLGICLIVAIVGAAVVIVCGRFFTKKQASM